MNNGLTFIYYVPTDSFLFFPSAATTAERFFRIDRSQEHLHYVTDISCNDLYILHTSALLSNIPPVGLPLISASDLPPDAGSSTRSSVDSPRAIDEGAVSVRRIVVEKAESDGKKAVSDGIGAEIAAVKITFSVPTISALDRSQETSV